MDQSADHQSRLDGVAARTSVRDWQRDGVSYADMRKAIATRHAGDHITREYRDALVIAVFEAEQRPPRTITIVRNTTGEVAKTSDVTGWPDRRIAKLIDGMSINLDHANWTVIDSDGVL